LAIQGPKAVEAMQALSSVDFTIKYYHFEVADFAT
jgi:aminomethyltransferase